MRDPASHFAPRRLFLRAQKIREIFEYDNVAQSLAGMLQCGHSYCHVEF